MGLYNNFTNKETHSIGKKFKVKCLANYNYESQLTEDKEYEVEVVERTLPMSPMCKFIGDEGTDCQAHLTRFEKVGV